jgi:hypothetical protein
MKRTLCIIYYSDVRFENLAYNAGHSFNKFHPEVNTLVCNLYDYVNNLAGTIEPIVNPISHGYIKFSLACHLSICGGYEKIIILGADTITCARLNEFIDDDESDVIATLDFNYPLLIDAADEEERGSHWRPGRRLAYISPILVEKDASSDRQEPARYSLYNPNPYLESFFDINQNINSDKQETAQQHAHIITNPDAYKFQFLHLNADVVCFNNLTLLKHVVDFCFQTTVLNKRFDNKIPMGFINNYHEQGSLNFCLFAGYGSDLENKDIGEVNLDLFSKNMKKPKISIPEITNKDIIYNVRSHRSQENVLTELAKQNSAEILINSIATKKDIDFIKQYYVDDNKLFTSEGKQIKVWHYCDDFGRQKQEDFAKLEKKWIDTFNKETKDFFANNCNCGDYFK